MEALTIPQFLAPQHGNALPSALVAAIRYDYEVSLLSIAQLTEKYADLAGNDSIRQIAAYKLHPGVRAARCSINWLRRQKEKTK